MSLVTIIIPTWNAEEYLRKTLQSIEVQTHADLQVLIVDDESSDASPYIAQQFAEKDSRFRHIRQANRGPGPGGGRNGGLPYVEGQWIFFQDADDLIPPDAIEKLVEVGDRTGSDIVTGRVARFRSDGRQWMTPNHSQSHSVGMEKTHISRHPVLAYDSTAWNKLYRTTFWNGAGREFPERKLFEDINPITRAHCESASTDVITDVVYLWRIRDDETSITQQVADERTFADKIEQMTLAHQYLIDAGYHDVRKKFEQKTLTRDFDQGVDDIEHGDFLYAKMVCTDGAAFLDRMLPESLAELPVKSQLKFHLCREGRIDDLRDLLTGGYDDSESTIKKSGESGPAVVNDFAVALHPEVPERLTEAGGYPPLKLGRVFLDWGDNEDVVISAVATIPGLAGRFGEMDELYLQCRHPIFGFSVPITPLPLGEGGLQGFINGLQVDRKKKSVSLGQASRFSVSIPLASLILPDEATNIEWRFGVGGRARGIERRTPLPALNPDRLPSTLVTRIDDLSYELTVTKHVNLTVRRQT